TGEAHARPGEMIQVWGLDAGLAVATRISITQVVRQDKQNIRPRISASGSFVCWQRRRRRRPHRAAYGEDAEKSKKCCTIRVRESQVHRSQFEEQLPRSPFRFSPSSALIFYIFYLPFSIRYSVSERTREKTKSKNKSKSRNYQAVI